MLYPALRRVVVADEGECRNVYFASPVFLPEVEVGLDVEVA